MCRIVHVQGAFFSQQLDVFLKHVGTRLVLVDNQCHSGDLILGYDDPTLLGADRMVAILAAYHLYRAIVRPLIVIDCGTAVTVDALLPSGEHLGGVILPGYRLWMQCLTQNTQQIRLGADTAVSQSSFAHNTRDAVSSAAEIGLPGAVWAIIQAMSCELAQKNIQFDPLVLTTGGDGAKIAAVLGMDAIYKPNLIFSGLEVILKQGEKG